MQATDPTPGALALRDETAVTRADPEQVAGALQHILATGDLSKLTNQQRVAHYLHVTSSLGLNPASRPFDWLILDGKLVLYPNKSCAEQLRRQHQISIKVTRFDVIGGDTKEPMVVVSVEGRRPNGQTDEATKYVSLMGYNSKTSQTYRLSGKALADAYAKCETAAKRRLTLSMVGLAAPPDDAENARYVTVDGTGRIIDNPTDQEKALAEDPRLARVLGEPTFETTASASESPLAGTVSQAPTIDELTPPKRPYSPSARFHCDAEQWRRTWFAVVKGTVFDSDDARRDFIHWYTSEWPENLRTGSLTTLLSRSTDRQAERMINAVREAIAYQAETYIPPEGGQGQLLEDQDERESRLRGNAPDADERTRAAAMVTGAPSGPTSEQAGEIVRPDPNRTYSRRDLVTHYLAAVTRMKSFDRTFRPVDIDRQSDGELFAAWVRIYDESDAIEEAISVASEPDDDERSEQTLAF